MKEKALLLVKKKTSQLQLKSCSAKKAWLSGARETTKQNVPVLVDHILLQNIPKTPKSWFLRPVCSEERFHTMKKTWKWGWKDGQLLRRWPKICWETGELPTALNCQYIASGKLEMSAQLWLGSRLISVGASAFGAITQVGSNLISGSEATGVDVGSTGWWWVFLC